MIMQCKHTAAECVCGDGPLHGINRKRVPRQGCKYSFAVQLGRSFTCCAVRRGNSFRSVHAAMREARDGDQIILRKGIHNGLG